MRNFVKDEELFSQDNLFTLGLFIAAIALYTTGLGDLPLRDWDEGIVAGVARNIWRANPSDNTWLYPTLNNLPYWNKPPLIHWLIAISYQLWGVNEWSTRIIPSLLSASVVPLLYKIAREIFVNPLPAILAALVYLTLLPIARHGRLAMLDGAVTCWFCLAVFCLLRGRKCSRWLLGTGWGIGLICLTKGMMMGVLLGGILLIFVFWDCPRLWRNSYLWTGLLLGIIPAIAWYGLQYGHYGSEFLGISLGKQTFNRIWEPVSRASSPPWYYLLEIAKYSLPWLIFLPRGIKLAVQNRDRSWGKLVLVWVGVYLLAISLMATKLPWYIIPIYPALALLMGISLAVAWQTQSLLASWKIGLSFVAIVCWLGGGWYGLIYLQSNSDLDLTIILAVVALSFTLATVLLWMSSRYFIPILIAGFYLALLLLFNSNDWLWELNEAFPVKPVAAAIREHTPPQQSVYSAYPNHRPALEFYSDRLITPTSDELIKQYWQQQPAYFLVDGKAIERLGLNTHQELGNYEDNVPWRLITQSNNALSP